MQQKDEKPRKGLAEKEGEKNRKANPKQYSRELCSRRMLI
jgi:hypothetical protein